MRRMLERVLERSERPTLTSGLLTCLGVVAAVTALIYPLRELAPVASLGVVYLVGVLLISTIWGARLGALASLASAAAFNFFHLPPVGRFTIADSRNWVALATLLVGALVVSAVAEVARARALEAEARRREAGLGEELARLLLGGAELAMTLPLAAHRVARVIGAPSAAIELGPGPGGIPLRHDETLVGRLIVPNDLPAAGADTLDRVGPALGSILAAAIARERLQAEVVETASLRRSDELKTALLRSVSHDLRTPVTAILTAATALSSPGLDAPERAEVQLGIVDDAARLSRLIDKLLDLSRLEAGIAEPQKAWCSIDEVLREAAADVRSEAATLSWAIAADLPLLRADATQLERAFANLVENAVRHGAGHPVSIRARALGHRMLVRIVDRGPGIPAAEQERIFAPFYRSAPKGSRHRGSGLGLAIAKGFVEANGGRITVESLPGQGTSFVVELPLEPEPAPGPEIASPRLGAAP